MKELKYKKDLYKQIKHMNNLSEKMHNFIMNLVLLGAIGIGIFLTLSFGFAALTMYLMVIMGYCGYEIVHIIYKTVKKVTASRNLDNLVNILDDNNIVVDKFAIEKSLCKEKTNSNEEIIKRYFMLDKEDKIKVLQETIKSYEGFNKLKKTRNLYLLDEEDLKAIEMPKVTLSLKYRK